MFDHYMALTLTDEGKIYLLDPTTNWESSYPKRGSKEYVINDIVSIYGEIRWAHHMKLWMKIQT